MAANFAADFERPPRRPILDRYLVTSEGTHSTYRKPLSSSSCALTPEIFASYSLQIRWLRIEGERRITQRLAAVDQRTPLIFITAHDDPEVRSAAKALGCAAYFRKTDSGKEVLEAIRRVTQVVR
jgi:DNA-binding NtrC family response regulator